MRLCPLGHENPDDATRCVVCYRRLSEEPTTVEFTRVPAGPVEVRANETTTIRVGLVQHEGDAATYDVDLAGKVDPWLSGPLPPVTLTPEEPADVEIVLNVPEDALPGPREISLEARGRTEDPPSARTELVVDVVALPLEETPPVPAPPPPAPVPRRPVHPQPVHPEPVHPQPVRPGPVRPEPDGSRVPRIVAWLLAALAFVVAVVFVVNIFGNGNGGGGNGGGGNGGGGNGGGGGGLTAAEALAMAPEEARPVLDDIRGDDAARFADLLAVPEGWVVQLSSKCALFDSVDIDGPQGLGVPDGVDESYPGGVGDNGVLAFHLGAVQQWGPTVLLTTGEDWGRGPCADGRPFWMTLDAPEGGAYASPREALCQCQERGLPFGECAARPLDGGEPLFWSEAIQPQPLVCT